MQKYLPKHLYKKSIALQSILVKKSKNDWKNKPASWPDIRKNAQDGHIYLLIDTRYPVGFISTVIDGYSVKIDGVAYGDYNSQAQFSIADWANYTATEGYTIDYPTESTKAHIIDIYPTTEGNDITIFRITTVNSTNSGVLWAHHNQTNTINLSESYKNCPVLTAITAKNNKLNISGLYTAIQSCPILEYLPVFNGASSNINADNFLSFSDTIKNINIKNSDKLNVGRSGYCANLEKIKVDKYLFVSIANNLFRNCPKLKQVPPLQFSNNITIATDVLANDFNLEDFDIDMQNCSLITKFTCYGLSSANILNLKSLRVSNEAPFNNATPPQINVSYTGMNRSALVQLFEDLPTVTGGQIINVTGCTGVNDLTADDKAIATAKGWTITL